MFDIPNHPYVVFVVSFVTMWVSAHVGSALLRRHHTMDNRLHEHFGFILAASLTLLGLIVGFSFSVAAGRYDQRKNYEESEANAIGTEYLRADLLPPAAGAQVRSLLKTYLDERIQFYLSPEEDTLADINNRTNKTQTELWNAIIPAANAQPTPVMALAVSGMNDVLNSQGYTQSAWWYRIPSSAWALMLIISLGCNLLIGYGSRGLPKEGGLLLVLPMVISIAFMLVADIDSPRHGIIRVVPQNLVTLANSLRSP